MGQSFEVVNLYWAGPFNPPIQIRQGRLALNPPSSNFAFLRKDVMLLELKLAVVDVFLYNFIYINFFIHNLIN